tara:strand:- start:476 stop:601 length:126 start_codon:yes stop_codon:yes gene_type:complete
MLGLGLALFKAYSQVLETLFDTWNSINDSWENIDSQWENLG